MKSTGRLAHPIASTALYLAMGWLVLLAIEPLLLKVPTWGLFWLIAGGVAYTVGVAFFAAEQVRYGHFVWHLFVVVGTACHFNAVMWYAA
jgi:hemolysin III